MGLLPVSGYWLDQRANNGLFLGSITENLLVFGGAGSPPVLISPVVSNFYTNERHVANIKSKA